MRNHVRAAIDQALGLVFPVECAGCGEPDTVVCPPCASALSPRPRCMRTTGGLQVWSGVPFEGPVARIVRAMKEDGRTALAPLLAPALRAAVDRAGGGDVPIVPIPTSARAMRRRGFRVVDLIARQARCDVRRVLVGVRRTSDQRGLGREARLVNVHESLRARSRLGGFGGPVVIVDDVVTTGATVDEAARALRTAGIRVLGAATVAATPARTDLR